MSFKAYYLFELLNQIRQMSIKMNASNKQLVKYLSEVICKHCSKLNVCNVMQPAQVM